jgi:hypothetical protein
MTLELVIEVMPKKILFSETPHSLLVLTFLLRGDPIGISRGQRFCRAKPAYLVTPKASVWPTVMHHFGPQ